MQEKDYKLRAILNTNYKPVKYRIQGKPHYQIFLEIYSESDPNLEQVNYVEYKLHPTFKESTRVTTNRSNNFQIEINAWGTFEVGVIIALKNNDKIFFRQDIKEVLKRVPI